MKWKQLASQQSEQEKTTVQMPFAFLNRLSRRALFAGLGAVLLAGGLVAGTALAADPTPTPKPNTSFQDFVSKLAGKLGKSEAEVSGALAATQRDYVDQAVKDGKLSQAAADRLKERLAQGPAPFGAFPQARAVAKARVAKAVGKAVGREIQVAAAYVGVPIDKLHAELKAGKSLAEVALANGKTREGLKTALTASPMKKLDDAVAAGKITADQKAKLQAQLDKRVDQLIDRKADPKGGRGPGKVGPKATPAPRS